MISDPISISLHDFEYKGRNHVAFSISMAFQELSETISEILNSFF